MNRVFLEPRAKKEPRVTPVLPALLVKMVLQGQEVSPETEVCLALWVPMV